ncbi:MAG TPA: biotin carboxylase N-terminal domain-containing protein [Candidatus Limnocylindrales bacterium]|nr:biotin carboxylase N-terminal domain-containing protein [Candidatus Limnocylindrales bacterium]
MTARPERPFRRVLVANRGEIALRIIRACRELGVETVAVYSDADRAARHVRAADQAVRLGPAEAGASYLRAELLVDAALATGAQAIHPGYGFLSERPTFAEACTAAGLVFIGPEAVTLAGLGDKLAARRAASKVGVPVVPGTLEPAAVGDPMALAELVRTAERIGWPVLVKAAAGGGGRGMRRVERAADLATAIGSASHEAAAAFGDGTVYLERVVQDARHVEVQLLGDAQGTIVACGERDCSVQRRHQKLVEEAPAPGMSPDARRALHAHAVAVAQAVGLRNAATAEFLLQPDGAVWFLEVNARLQVEHGVTELVTGLDLVAEQLWIAAGRPLSPAVLAAAARAAEPDRHAVEVRLSAEDPGAAFAPRPGTITAWREPGGPGVRVDGWVEPGTVVTSDYDPLLAKILTVAADRPAALARMARALDEVEVGGLQTTLPFDRWLLAEPAFRSAQLSIDLVDRLWQPQLLREAAARAAARLAAAASAMPEAAAASAMPVTAASAHPSGAASPASRQDGGSLWDTGAWRLAGRRAATREWPA